MLDKHIGNDFDQFLKEEGLFAEVEAVTRIESGGGIQHKAEAVGCEPESHLKSIQA